MAKSALQILRRPVPDAVERLLDVLDRVGYAETQIALAEGAKSGPRERGDPGIITRFEIPIE